MKLRFLAIIAISSSLLLAGCGSDSDTTDTGGNGGGKTSDPSITGVVSNTTDTSITVNAVTYDTTSATVVSDSSTGIAEGMMVTVEGPHSNGQGVANKIIHDSEVEGLVISANIVEVSPADPADPVTYEGTMDVMGQAVIIDSMTIFSDIDDPTAIMKDNVVEVSGMFQDDGSILAKRVEYKSMEMALDEEIEIKGYVTDYDATGGEYGMGSFMLGMCEIIVTADTEFDDIEMLEEGMKVEVQSSGEFVQTDPSCVVEALEIENEDHNGYHDMDYAKGMVVGELIDGMFTLQYDDHEPVTVMIDELTHFVNGTIVDIVEGAKLKAVGMYDENNVLKAELIKFKEMEMEFDKIEGQVISEFLDGMFDLKDSDGNIVTVMVDTETAFAPMGATAADIQLDVNLKAVGMYDNSTPPKLMAKLIKLDSMDNNLEKVKGTVVGDLVDGMFELEDKDGNTHTIMVTVDTKYLPMDATVDDIKDGAMLKVVGMINGDNLDAVLITFKDMGGVNPPMPGVPPMVKYHGSVEAVVLTDVNDPELGGTLTVLGQVITVTEETKIYMEMMTDPMPAPMASAEIMKTLADINVDDYVMVMPYKDDMGVLTARVIEVKPTPEIAKSMVFGPIMAADVANGTVTISHVMVTVDSMTEITPMGTDLTAIADALQAGTELKAKAEGMYDATMGIKASHIAVHETVVIM